MTRSFDISFNARALLASREKRLIGMRATALISEARVLFVGIGSTTEQFAHYLPGRSDLTVVTPSYGYAHYLRDAIESVAEQQGITVEHKAVRERCGLFDVSHMGQLALRPKSGQVKDAALALERLVQRIAVTLALAAEILIARRMLILPVTGSAAGPGVTPGQGAPASQGG